MQNILQNQSFTFSPAVEVRDTGWSLSGGKAIHVPCNSGTINSINNLGLEIGKTYTVTYEISGYSSGTVQLFMGTTAGTVRTANGVYTESLLCAGSAEISFFSDGGLTIEDNLSFFDSADIDNAVTIAFFDGEESGNIRKKWTTYYSYEPEMMIKFINNFFTIKDGALWMHNVNPIYNNFYGEQFQSKVQFYDNLNPTQQKLYFSMRQEATTPWVAQDFGDISIIPVMGRKSFGMSSRLRKNNFKNYQGSFFADFMRNAADSRFEDDITSLYKGEPLRGRYMELLLTNSDDQETILFEIDIKSAPSMLTY